MNATTALIASCTCGRVTLRASGNPILSAACHCESCRSAARHFEQAPGAPSILNEENGVDYCLYRKDRVKIIGGGESLREYRLAPTSPTRRVYAACCNTPMFLDFTKGHWLTLYRDRLPESAPSIEIHVMARDLPANTAILDERPVHSGRPASFLVRVLASWIAMGFRRPSIPP